MAFHIRKILGAFALVAIIGSSSAFAAQKTSHSANANQDKDKIFIGGGLMLGGYGSIGAEFTGGWQHYFPHYIAKRFRQGIRVWGSVGYSYDGSDNSYRYSSRYTYHYFPVLAGADYTIDFTPHKKFVWSAFAGLGIGFMPIYETYTYNGYYYDEYHTYTRFRVGYTIRSGGAVTINNTHRIEASFGSGISYLTLRYMFLF